MDGPSAFRRAFHLASPVFLGYYLLPEVLPGGITRLNVTLLFLGTAWCIEIARIALGVRLFGMRPYEGQRVSAYAQGLLGFALGLFLVDWRIVVPVFFGMAWIDPLCAFGRRKRWPLWLPAVAYFALYLAIEIALGSFGWTSRVLFAALAAATAILVEGPRIPQVDDDLLMLLAPMAVVTAAALALGGGLL